MFTFLVLSIVFATCVYGLLSSLSKKSNYWKNKGVPTLKNESSFIDLVLKRKAPMEEDKDRYREMGDEKMVGLMEVGTPTLFVKDLELIKLILVKDFDNFTDRRTFIDTDPLFSKSLFMLQGDKWRSMRHFLSPTFTTGKIKRMFHNFESTSKKVLEYVEKTQKPVLNGHEIDVSDVTGRITIDVIGAVAFGIETDSLAKKDSYFYKMARKAAAFEIKEMLKFAFFQFYPDIGNFFKMQMFSKDVSDFFGGILKETFRRRETAQETREDFLQILVETKREQANDNSEEKLEFTEDVAVSQAFLFFMAGFDTVSNILAMSLYVLAVRQDIQEKVYQEVSSVLGATEGKLLYEDTGKLQYLDMVISEILRMYAPLVRLERRCIKDYQVPGTKIVIPKDTIVVIPSECLHYDPKYYPDPHVFDPERFSPEAKAERNPYTYLPFGTGPRSCIAMRLGLAETKTVLAYILYDCKVGVVEGQTPVPVETLKKFGVVRTPANLKLTMTRRVR